MHLNQKHKVVYICSASNLILIELNTLKEHLLEHKENALLPLDFLVVYMSLYMCKRKENHTGALVKTNEENQENEERRGEEKRKMIKEQQNE